MSIEIYFIRHGESVNNKILKSAGGLGTILYPIKFQQDPFLTEKGQCVATENGERIVQAKLEFDLVMTSAMRRTIETAFFALVRTGITDRLVVAPFVSETPLSFFGLPIYENIPIEREDQIRTLGRVHGSQLLDALDWSLVGGPSGDNKATYPPSGKKFLHWLYTQEVVQELLKEDRTIKIAVCTHSHFMMENDTLALERKPSNVDIWKSKLHVATPGPVLSLTDLQGWYRERTDCEKKKIESKLAITRQKSQKKHKKYSSKIERLRSPQDELEDTKKQKKVLKYQKRLDRKQARYERKATVLEQAKDGLVDLSHVEIELASKLVLTE
mmetsp:Transcript_20790/g.34402  ORF Transcript_20790/g.34402 Transcript_20790/m.34402 type:complete len:328 (+) Transcript_20790:1194-2177(+)|eukprot:CAMPEP_0203803882 /NCGR_PEP_ID=MMETSP0100_2-20121128/13172_1 /ASSEMBLY_ACC=CAM_ASM_000210 /TAXON_ID=96639 /ORGANISM=" , Strain NY0313808BC1" /LENGTH=327 /DNA_ID=CAMNT_0050711831 /DNA_START=1095 /DNA_END=2078 /DNA_ORIENTATION=+